MKITRYAALFALLASTSACSYMPDSWSDWVDNTPVVAEPSATADKELATAAEAQDEPKTPDANTDKSASKDVSEINEDSPESAKAITPAAPSKAEATAEKSEVASKPQKSERVSRFTSNGDDETYPNLAEMPPVPDKSEMPSKREISETRKALEGQLDEKSNIADRSSEKLPVPEIATNHAGETVVKPLADKMVNENAGDSPQTDTAKSESEAPHSGLSSDKADGKMADTAAAETDSSTPSEPSDTSAAKDQELVGQTLGLGKAEDSDGYQLKNISKPVKFKGGSAATIYFPAEGTGINQAQYANLKKIAELAKHGNLRMQIVSTPVNEDMPTLGTQRLITLAAYLVDFGVEPDKIQLKLVDKFPGSEATTSPRAEVLLSK